MSVCSVTCLHTFSIYLLFFIMFNIITNEDFLLFFIRFAWPVSLSVSVLTLWNAAHLKLCNSLKAVHRPIRIQSSSLLTVTNSRVFGFGKSRKRVSLLVSRESEALSEERDVTETHESEWISIWASASSQWAQTEQRLVFSSRHTSVRQHVKHWDRESKTLMKEGRRRWQWRTQRLCSE